MNQVRIAQAIANLDGWLETMRQAGGYGGPVSHWWQNGFQFTGPGLDWRYEGILTGYARLYDKTRDPRWCHRLGVAAQDLLDGQRTDGSYRASRFEINPDTLGTPHEAAATLGLLAALPLLANRSVVLEVARRNLDNLIGKLWDGDGFNDRPGVPGRVPNKLATLALALMYLSREVGDEAYLDYARAALDDVLWYQVTRGRHAGAVHQYGPRASRGDGRFFPYYNARCIPPLVEGAQILGDERYLDAALRILAFIERELADDGSWPQVVYASGARADWPRWCAGSGDVLLAFHVLHRRMPSVTLERLLACQRPSGAFPTAAGFGRRIRPRLKSDLPDHRDAIPAAGWNDKAFRLLAELLPQEATLPASTVGVDEQVLSLAGLSVAFRESAQEVTLSDRDRVVYHWVKSEPWARAVLGGSNVR